MGLKEGTTLPSFPIGQFCLYSSLCKQVLVCPLNFPARMYDCHCNSYDSHTTELPARQGTRITRNAHRITCNDVIVVIMP
jgi:hypothetical protein